MLVELSSCLQTEVNIPSGSHLLWAQWPMVCLSNEMISVTWDTKLFLGLWMGVRQITHFFTCNLPKIHHNTG